MQILGREMTHGDFFSGFGGFTYAARAAGIKTLWHVENGKYARFILKKLYPESKLYGDIKKLDYKQLERVDVLTAGMPCQPFSLAGKMLGTKDERWLWQYLYEAIRYLRPSWILFENVPNIIKLAFPIILPDLEKIGYTFPKDLDGNYIIPIIPALAVGAWHLRKRVWLIAYSDSERCQEQCGTRTVRKEYNSIKLHTCLNTSNSESTECKRTINSWSGWNGFTNEIINTSNSDKLYGNISRHGAGEDCGKFKEQIEISEKIWEGNWLTALTGICRTYDGIPYRIQRLFGMGNAVVPQIPFRFFRIIMEMRAK